MAKDEVKCMEMPRIWTAKMAMNEAVAATCCYEPKLNDANKLIGILQVLFGGYISAKELRNYKRKLICGINNKTVVDPSGTAIYAASEYVPHPHEHTSACYSRYYDYQDLADDKRHKWDAWDLDLLHINATEVHDGGGKNWMKPHDAQQFST